MTNWPRNTSISNENSRNALPEQELRRRQADGPELLRVPDGFERNFCNQAIALKTPGSGMMSEMAILQQLTKA
jgi:hypothetical protein